MNTQIDTTRLTLRPFVAADADDAFACITTTLTRYMAWEPPADHAQFATVWQQWQRSMADRTEFAFVIRERHDGRFAGLVGVHHLRTDTPELGIWIREDRHGYGFGHAAVAAVARWASATFNPEGFAYPVAEDNTPSRRIAEALGGVIVDRLTTPKYLKVVYRIPPQRADVAS